MGPHCGQGRLGCTAPGPAAGSFSFGEDCSRTVRLPTYPVVTGDYDAVARWESRAITPGTPLSPPVPLFTKLAPSIVDEELGRLEQPPE